MNWFTVGDGKMLNIYRANYFYFLGQLSVKSMKASMRKPSYPEIHLMCITWIESKMRILGSLFDARA